MKPYWEDSRSGITIYHGDCREILPTLEPVDHVITDPPYGDVTHEGARGGEGDTKLVTFASIDMATLRCIFGMTRPRRWLVASMEWRHIAQMEPCPPDGLRFVRFGIWRKPNGAPQFTGDRPATGWEGVGIFHALGGAMRWNGGGNHAVWTFPKINGDHPTEKPEGLLRKWVTDFTDPGETILDPFMGSGTTLVAAYQLGRKAIGIELEEKWAEVAVKRLESQTPPLFTIPAEKPVQTTYDGWADTSWLVKGGYVEDTE